MSRTNIFELRGRHSLRSSIFLFKVFTRLFIYDIVVSSQITNRPEGCKMAGQKARMSLIEVLEQFRQSCGAQWVLKAGPRVRGTEAFEKALEFVKYRQVLERVQGELPTKSWVEQRRLRDFILGMRRDYASDPGSPIFALLVIVVVYQGLLSPPTSTAN